MSDIPKTVNPHMVDVCLTNNPKLTAAFTSYQKQLNIFPMESLISYTNNYNKHVHDPVTAEKEFYINLNNQDDPAVKLEYIDNTDIGLDGNEDVFSENEYWNTHDYDIEGIKKDIYEDEPNYPFQLPSEKRSEEANLKEILERNTEFILFWVEKFRCIHKTVKEEIFSEIPKDTPGGIYNTENVYFNNFNESMYHLRDAEFIKDRTTTTMLDENLVKSPHTYNVCQMNNIDSDTYDTAEELMNRSTLKFKLNMKNICSEVKKDEKHIAFNMEFPDTNMSSLASSLMTAASWYTDHDTESAHGNNMVTDTKHPVRIKTNIDAVQAKMNEILGDMKRVFDFLNKHTRDNNEQWGKYNKYYFVEGIFEQIDQFKRELMVIGANTAASSRTNQVLS